MSSNSTTVRSLRDTPDEGNTRVLGHSRSAGSKAIDDRSVLSSGGPAQGQQIHVPLNEFGSRLFS